MHFKTHIVNIILAAVTTAEIQTTRYKGTRMCGYQIQIKIKNKPQYIAALR